MVGTRFHRRTTTIYRPSVSSFARYNDEKPTMSIKQFYRFALTIVVFTAVIAGIIALKGVIWFPDSGL